MKCLQTVKETETSHTPPLQRFFQYTGKLLHGTFAASSVHQVEQCKNGSFHPPSHVTISTTPGCLKAHYSDCRMTTGRSKVRAEKPSAVHQQQSAVFPLQRRLHAEVFGCFSYDDSGFLDLVQCIYAMYSLRISDSLESRQDWRRFRLQWPPCP